MALNSTSSAAACRTQSTRKPATQPQFKGPYEKDKTCRKPGRVCRRAEWLAQRPRGRIEEDRPRGREAGRSHQMGPPRLFSQRPSSADPRRGRSSAVWFLARTALIEIEPRLKKGGKYEMATVELREGMTIKPAIVRRLTKEAVALNQKLGDPTKAAKLSAKAKKSSTKKPTKKPV